MFNLLCSETGLSPGEIPNLPRPLPLDLPGPAIRSAQGPNILQSASLTLTITVAIARCSPHPSIRGIKFQDCSCLASWLACLGVSAKCSESSERGSKFVGQTCINRFNIQKSVSDLGTKTCQNIYCFSPGKTSLTSPQAVPSGSLRQYLRYGWGSFNHSYRRKIGKISISSHLEGMAGVPTGQLRWTPLRLRSRWDALSSPAFRAY